MRPFGLLFWWLETVKKLDGVDSRLQRYGLMLPLLFVTFLLAPVLIIEAWWWSQTYERFCEVWGEP